MIARRVIAAVVDAGLWFALSSLLFLAVADGSVDDGWHLTPGERVLVTTVSYGYLVGMLVVLQGRTGATPGKAVTGLRTVDEAGAPPGLGRAFGRTVLWFVDGAPWVVPGVVAFVTALTTPGHRRVGDMACRTYVVRAEAMGRPVTLP